MSDGDWIKEGLPRGETLPVGCTYLFSFGKAKPDGRDLPPGWLHVPLPPYDARVIEAGFPCASEEPVLFQGRPVTFSFLVSPDGEPVATWDEGRWWTPEESEAFMLMLRVPATYVAAEGLATQQKPRRERRNRKER